MKLNMKLNHIWQWKPCWRRSRRPLFMSWEASESQCGLNPSSHQVLLCWTNRSNVVPCLTSGPQFPERHKIMDHLLLSSSPSVLLPPSWSWCFSLCYSAGLDSLLLFLRFFLSRYTWKVLFWNVLVNSEVYGAASVLTASQKRGWGGGTRSWSFSPGPSMIWEGGRGGRGGGGQGGGGSGEGRGLVFHHGAAALRMTASCETRRVNQTINRTKKVLKE